MTVHLPLASSSSSTTLDISRKSLSSLSLVVAKSKRVVVVTGAGISCSSGIPDFRSSDGLYALVKSRYPDTVLNGRDLFSASLFRDPASTKLFYTFIAELKTSVDLAKPSLTHHFIKTLDAKGKLLRSYTQNIDGFEQAVGLADASSAKGKGKGGKINVKEVKNIQLHGNIHGVRCKLCSAEYPCTPGYLESFREGIPPACPDCSERSAARRARSARALAVGTLRPNIVLYDEAHPLGDEIGAVSTRDMTHKPDLLIIMGTSLKVHGLKRLVKDFAAAVHQPPTTRGKAKLASGIATPSPTPSPSKPKAAAHTLSAKNPRIVVYVNRTPPPPGVEWANVIDYWVEGDTDDWVQRCESDWRGMRPQDWEIQPTLFDALSAAAPKNKHGELADAPDWAVTKNISNKVSGKKAKPRSTSKKPSMDSENIPPPVVTIVSPPSTPVRPRPVRSKSKASATKLETIAMKNKARKPASQIRPNISQVNVASSPSMTSSQETLVDEEASDHEPQPTLDTWVDDEATDVEEHDVEEVAAPVFKRRAPAKTPSQREHKVIESAPTKVTRRIATRKSTRSTLAAEIAVP